MSYVVIDSTKLRKDIATLFEAAGLNKTGADDIADALVHAGVPFRDAHHRVGALVHRCAAQKTELESLTPEQWSELAPELTAEQVQQALDPVVSLGRRSQPGGPAPVRVEEAQVRHSEAVGRLRARVTSARANTELMQWLREDSD